jgi:hypothetical protein
VLCSRWKRLQSSENSRSHSLRISSVNLSKAEAIAATLSAFGFSGSDRAICFAARAGLPTCEYASLALP